MYTCVLYEAASIYMSMVHNGRLRRHRSQAPQLHRAQELGQARQVQLHGGAHGAVDHGRPSG